MKDIANPPKRRSAPEQQLRHDDHIHGTYSLCLKVKPDDCFSLGFFVFVFGFFPVPTIRLDIPRPAAYMAATWLKERQAIKNSNQCNFLSYSMCCSLIVNLQNRSIIDCSQDRATDPVFHSTTLWCIFVCQIVFIFSELRWTFEKKYINWNHSSE